LLLDMAIFPLVLTWKKELENDFLVDYNLNWKKKPNVPQIIAYYQPKILVLLGDKEIKSEKIMLKQCQEKQEFLVKKEELVKWIYKLLKGK
jgi:histidyl-tRNA synthetase